MQPVTETGDQAETQRVRGSTTILLSEREAEHWIATQDGVPVEGHGETAAEAAAEYCRNVDSMDG